ncbi:MAG: hypothetical protein NTY46_10850 [Candidatus Sumerlaeota bacterium]|nr:hypothetical protein [Candidatus Sumerlaeota bacterium]
MLKSFAARVRAHFPAARIWIYGARATGKARKDCPYEICIVHDPMDWPHRKTISTIALETGFEYGELINTMKLTSNDFERGPSSLSKLLQSIRQKGVAL